jgi:hypothetical protein
MRCTAIFLFIMFCEYMFRCYLFPFILLFSTSSMFELHVLVAAVVMLNILKLIMEIVPNFPTVRSMDQVLVCVIKFPLRACLFVASRSYGRTFLF